MAADKEEGVNVQNGMALCRLCHWTFDEGLILFPGHTPYLCKTVISEQQHPQPYAALSGPGIIGPAEQALWLEPESLH
jgi:putative restriction endonuclease